MSENDIIMVSNLTQIRKHLVESGASGVLIGGVDREIARLLPKASTAKPRSRAKRKAR